MMRIVLNRDDKNYYITSTIDPDMYIRIPDEYRIGESIAWFHNTQCTSTLNQNLVITDPSIILHRQNGEKLYPIRTLSRMASLHLLKSKWCELSPNPIIGTLCF